MKVYFAAATALDRPLTPIPAFEDIARNDRFGIHSLTSDPAAADVILFVDAHQHADALINALRVHPLLQKYRDKVLVYDERDQPWCSMAGIYVSMPASTFDPERQRSYSYYTTNHNFTEPLAGVPKLLFSFMGSRTHKIRNRVLLLSHERAHIEDTSKVNFFDFSDRRDPQKIEAQKHRFAEVLEQSKFVICPRGTGTSSIRMYEVMAAGRVPVIISDEWVAPTGIEWERCSFRVREADIEHVPALLEVNEARFEEMARQARQVYDDWFGPDVVFHHLVEHCQNLLESGLSLNRRRSHFLDRQYLRSGFHYFKIQARVQVGKKLTVVRKLLQLQRANAW